MKKIYCFSVTISLFLSHNKLYSNDLIYCFNINSCIFLFSTMSKKVCMFSLYIFCLNKNLSDVFIVSEWQYNVVGWSNTLLLQLYLYVFLLDFIPIVLELCLYILVLYKNSLAIVHCSCPIIFLFSHTHTQ